MKRALVLSCLCSAWMTSQAFANASVSSTQVAPIQNLLPNAYGEAQLRHYLVEKGLGHGREPLLQARYTLGSTFFSGILDSKWVFGLNKFPGNTVVAYRGTRLENYVHLFENEYLNVTSYAELTLPHHNYGTNAKTGILTEVAYEQSTPAGMVGVGGSFDVAGYYGSRPGPDKVSVFDTEGRALSASRVPHYQTLGLSTSEDQGLYTYQTSSTINQETIASVSFQPNMLHGLNLMAMTYHINRYVPITEYDPAQDRIQERKAGRFQQTVYDRAYSRKQRLTAEYAWNQYNVSNDLYVMERVNGTRTFENVITWTAKLF